MRQGFVDHVGEGSIAIVQKQFVGVIVSVVISDVEIGPAVIVVVQEEGDEAVVAGLFDAGFASDVAEAPVAQGTACGVFLRRLCQCRHAGSCIQRIAQNPVTSTTCGAAWDATQTLQSNFVRLGLVLDPNKALVPSTDTPSDTRVPFVAGRCLWMGPCPRVED